MLLCVCSVLDHRWRLIVLKTKRSTWAAGECVTDVFTTFCLLLWSIADQPHGNMESFFFFCDEERRKSTYACILASYHLTVRGSICTSLRIFQVTNATFRPCFFSFFNLLAYSLSGTFFKAFPSLKQNHLENIFKTACFDDTLWLILYRILPV